MACTPLLQSLQADNNPMDTKSRIEAHSSALTARRAAELTQELLRYARELAELLRLSTPKNMVLETQIAPGPLFVEGDAGYLRQLPAATLAGSPPVAMLPTPDEPGGTVLVIDDEEGVRRVVERALGRAGLKVMLAADGRAGLDLHEQNAEQIDWVLLDLTMPLMSGHEVARALQTCRPGLPIVVMTGYSSEVVTQGAAGLGISAVLTKPFSMAELQAITSSMAAVTRRRAR
jgi:CheY-like chemotaxis protein